MSFTSDFDVWGKRAVLATMHGKERVLRPLLERGLGLKLHLPKGFDTDRFGTFSHEIERSGSQLDAARAKIAAAFEHDHRAQVAIASEGSFGPHPYIPLVPLGREIVLLHDRETGLEVIGRHADLLTNFEHQTVATLQQATDFAMRIGFPGHSLIAIGVAHGAPDPGVYICKEMETLEQLALITKEVIALCGSAHLQTDMRAHRNPTRMRSIKRAGIDLVRRYRNRCPACLRPGFSVTQRIGGLTCAWCLESTNALRAEISICEGCGHRVERPVEAKAADPGQCPHCNP